MIQNGSLGKPWYPCAVCGKSNNLSRIKFWNQSFCKTHDFDGTPACCSCDRFKQGDAKYINLGDGRKLCSDCFSTAVMDPKQLKVLIEKVHKFYKSLKIEVDKDIPILLVDKKEINRIANLEGLHCQPIGLTIYRAYDVTSVTKCSQKGENIEMVKKTKSLIKRKVTSILVLFGFPMVEIESILVHEMMHAWLRGQNVRLESRIAEGFCDALSYMWLKELCATIDPSSEASEHPQPVGEPIRDVIRYTMYKMDQDSTSAYANEFRDAKWAIDNFGLEATLKAITKTRNLPRKSRLPK